MSIGLGCLIALVSIGFFLSRVAPFQVRPWQDPEEVGSGMPPGIPSSREDLYKVFHKGQGRPIYGVFDDRAPGQTVEHRRLSRQVIDLVQGILMWDFGTFRRAVDVLRSDMGHAEDGSLRHLTCHLRQRLQADGVHEFLLALIMHEKFDAFRGDFLKMVEREAGRCLMTVHSDSSDPRGAERALAAIDYVRTLGCIGPDDARELYAWVRRVVEARQETVVSEGTEREPALQFQGDGDPDDGLVASDGERRSRLLGQLDRLAAASS